MSFAVWPCAGPACFAQGRVSHLQCGQSSVSSPLTFLSFFLMISTSHHYDLMQLFVLRLGPWSMSLESWTSPYFLLVIQLSQQGQLHGCAARAFVQGPIRRRATTCRRKCSLIWWECSAVAILKSLIFEQGIVHFHLSKPYKLCCYPTNSMICLWLNYMRIFDFKKKF